MLISKCLRCKCSYGVVLWKFGLSSDPGEDSGIHHQPAVPFIAGENSTTARIIRVLTRKKVGSVSAISWSPNGYYLAIGSKSHSKLIIWDVSSGETVALWRVGSGTSKLEWSPDGKLLLQGCSYVH